MERKNTKLLLIAFVITLAASSLALGQDSVALSVAPSALRALETGGIAEGQELKIEGIVINQNDQSFTVRDAQGSETVVLVTNQTVIKKKRRGWIYVPRTAGADEIRCGLRLKVKGRGNSDGQLVAQHIAMYPDPKPTKPSERIDFFDAQANSNQVPAGARFNQTQENAPLLWTIPINQHCGKCSHVCGEGCSSSGCPGQGGCN
ncbi:MAG TPA: DUF5666 domain-containing protein [Pyrinomonadaceae bacterium]